MLYGTLVGGVLVVSGDGSGRPVVETDPPECPEGYEARSRWVDTGREVVLKWELAPVEGTAAEAAVALSRMQAQSLPDEVAYVVRALFPEWVAGESYTGPDDPSGAPQSRVRYKGALYKCLQTHASQETWTPKDAPSLWAEVLPGQEGNEPEEGYAEWVQPESTNGYSTGDKVVHGGHLWESIVDANVDEPGTDNGFRWKDLGEYPGEEE